MAERLRVAVVGATGSVGSSFLEVCRSFRDRIEVLGLAAASSVHKLASLVEEFSPEYAVVWTGESAEELKAILKGKRIQRVPEVMVGMEGLMELARSDQVDHLSICSSGVVGMFPMWEALTRGKVVSLANKESLMLSGHLMERTELAQKLIPLDSEHSALWQCVRGEVSKPVGLLLTASGGPFWRLSSEELRSVRAEDALKHPVWSMGAKITVDSATLMNKGFEVIEASYLFDVPMKSIEVLVHPEALVHGIVSFSDGSWKAVLFKPDMRVPAAVALGLPHRLEVPDLQMGWNALGKGLSFYEPDLTRFPCLQLAREAGEGGAHLICGLVAADEVAVDLFLRGAIGFTGIPELVGRTLERVPSVRLRSLEEVMSHYETCRALAREVGLSIVGGG